MILSIEMQMDFPQWNAIDYLIITLRIQTNFEAICKFISVFLISYMCVLLELFEPVITSFWVPR